MTIINPYGGGQNSGTVNLLLPQQVKITSLPPGLNNLLQTLSIKGEVVGQSNTANQIQTPQGIVDINLKTPLPVGAKLDIQIASGQTPNRAIIQPLVDGGNKNNASSKSNDTVPKENTLQTASTQNVAGVKNLQQTVQQASLKIDGGSTLQPLAQGQIVRVSPLSPLQQNNAKLLGDNANTTPSSPAQKTSSYSLNQNTIPRFLPSTSLQSDLTRTIISTNNNPQPHTDATIPKNTLALSPIRNIHQSATTTLPSISSHSILNAQNNGETLRPIQSPIVTSDTKLLTRIDAMITRQPQNYSVMNIGSDKGNSSQSILTSDAKAGQIVATSTGKIDNQGRAIVTIPHSTTPSIGANSQPSFMVINYPSTPLPKGTMIYMTPTAAPTHQQVTPPQWQGLATMVNYVGTHPHLSSDMDDLLQLIPQLNHSGLINSGMKALGHSTTNQQFPAAALLFLAAAKGGDFGAWFGPRHTKNLSQSPMGQDIIKTLSDGLQSSGKTPSPMDSAMVQQPNADWRGITIPLLFGTAISEITLWTQRDKDQGDDDNNDNKNSSVTRFVVDVTLSRMGDIHIEGAINKNKKQFDIALLTQQNLSQPMKRNLNDIWHTTLGGLGLAGKIIYKVNDDA